MDIQWFKFLFRACTLSQKINKEVLASESKISSALLQMLRYLCAAWFKDVQLAAAAPCM